jgi:hypothetical protein
VSILEAELRANLQDARITGAGHKPEKSSLVYKLTGHRVRLKIWGPRIDAAVGVLKLSVVENIKRLESQFQAEGFGEFGVLKQRHIPVVQSRAVEEAAVGITDLAEGFEVKISPR